MVTLISPENKVVKIKNLKTFAAEHGLSYNSLRSLSCKRKKMIKGWKSSDYKVDEKYIVVNTRTHESFNIYKKYRQFAAQNNIWHASIGCVIRGSRVRCGPFVSKATYDLVYRQIELFSI